jgi:chromosomal replication initiation ATPase DnaA
MEPPDWPEAAEKTNWRLAGKKARLVGQVARSFGVSEEALYAAGRSSAHVSLARHTAMYLMHVVLRRNYSEVGAWFRRHRTSVFHACAKIEDRRDDPAFDTRIARLERALAVSQDAA